MSNYRDDVNDTVVMGDANWAGLRSIAESTIRVSDGVMSGLGMLVADGAVLSDSVHDRLRRIVDEHASLSDAVYGRATLRSLIAERARVGDFARAGLASLVTESLALGDEVILRTRAAVSETVVVQDVVIGSRIVRQLVNESAKLADAAPYSVRQLVVESAALADLHTDRLRGRSLVADSLSLADEVLGAFTSGPALVVELVRVSDEATGVLHARDMVSDMALAIWDEPLQVGADIGQAWTAPTDGWSTSRYAPFTFSSLAVIDGTAYAFGHDGVYALDGDGETINAEVRTGHVDMTGGVLCHPLQSIISYELTGSAWLDVWQTQGGSRAERYSYRLPAEPAAVLTSGRFVLGRGLRGRHFQYALRLSGQRAHINDWNVTVTPSKRSI